jgi:hypothetical protein
MRLPSFGSVSLLDSRALSRGLGGLRVVRFCLLLSPESTIFRREQSVALITLHGPRLYAAC